MKIIFWWQDELGLCLLLFDNAQYININPSMFKNLSPNTLAGLEPTVFTYGGERDDHAAKLLKGQ